jgi:hypothetical protein
MGSRLDCDFRLLSNLTWEVSPRFFDKWSGIAWRTACGGFQRSAFSPKAWFMKWQFHQAQKLKRGPTVTLELFECSLYFCIGIFTGKVVANYRQRTPQKS